MKERAIVTRRDLELIEISCDRCGCDMATDRGEGLTQWDPREGGMVPILNPEAVLFWEGESVEVSFGYGSRFDTDRVEFDLCDDCWEWFFRELKHLVIRGIAGTGEGTWDEANIQITEGFREQMADDSP